MVKKVTADFEKAVWNAVRTVYPGVKLTGCVFHWTQALWRKVSFFTWIYMYVRWCKHCVEWLSTYILLVFSLSLGSGTWTPNSLPTWWWNIQVHSQVHGFALPPSGPDRTSILALARPSKHPSPNRVCQLHQEHLDQRHYLAPSNVVHLWYASEDQ